MKLPSQRFDYSGIEARPRWSLPDDARVAVYVVVNVEDWDFARPAPRQIVPSPHGAAVVPDVQNWAWHEYGMRVGIWRLLKAMRAAGARASVPLNARSCETYEVVVRAMIDAGWSLMGHGVEQGVLHNLPDEREAILRSMAVLTEFGGRKPKGWLGPGLHETFDTLDYLAEAGFKFVCDWAMDEQPVTMRTTSSPLVAMPYSLETSDLPMMAVHHHLSSTWSERIRDTFDRLYAEGSENPRVMSISVHPYIMGVPHRVKYFEEALAYVRGHDRVWMTTANDIYDWHCDDRRH